MSTREPSCCICGETQTGISIAFAFDFMLDGVRLEELVCCDVEETQGEKL